METYRSYMRRLCFWKKGQQSLMFSSYFLALSHHHQYNLLGAIRGSDSGDYRIVEPTKRVITYRIRKIVFGNNTFSPVPLSTLPSPQKIATLPTHWRLHLADAIVASADHPIWEGRANELLDLLGPPSVFGQKIIGR